MCFLMIDQCNSFLVHLYYTRTFPQCPKVGKAERSCATVSPKVLKKFSPDLILSCIVAPQVPPRLPSPDRKRHALQGLTKENLPLSYHSTIIFILSSKVYLYLIIPQSYLSLGLSSKRLLKGLFLL